MSVIADGSLFAGSNSMLVFLPFLMAGAGLFFIVWAARDKVDQRDEPTVRRLPTKELYPLYHVHMRIRAATAEAKAAADAEQEKEQPPSARPRATPSGRRGMKLADGG
jgi:hypothetical protein